MGTGIYNIECQQGATLRRSFTWLDENEQPIDLTGASARMQVRPTHTSTTKWLDLTTATTALVIDVPTATIRLLVDAAVTATLPAKRGVYDLEVVFSTGEVYRLVEGAFVVTPEVTR